MNDAKNQPEKPKSPRYLRPFAIDFIVPIQLEECIARVENHASQIRVKIRRIGEVDRFVFHIEMDLSENLSVQGQGTMQRWQGTSTRVRGKLHAARPANFPNDFTSYLKLGCGLVLFIFAALAITDFSAYPLNLWVLACIGLFIILPIATLTIGAWISGKRRQRILIQHLRHLLMSES